MKPKIGILVVAYNAATTLAAVLDRIPTEFRPHIHEVLVADDHSQDSTYLVGVGYKETSELPLRIVKHPENLGYGGNQKWGYRWAIDNDWDIVVLLHGDGQYAPELLDRMVAPIVDGEAEAVFGSRIMDRGAARRGGMPAYKYVGNRILTTMQNRVVGLDLSEWHSGYRAYDVKALARLPFETNTDDFDFDTEIIIQLHEAGMRIREIPIPTYYGDEICYVNGLGYAKDVTVDVLRYRAHKMGLGTGELAFASDDYELKEDDDSSHGTLERWMALRSPSRVLDLGCADGSLGARFARTGHHVIGVDRTERPGVRDRIVEFYEGDLEKGIPTAAGDDFDVVVAADVLEHVRDPAAALDGIRDVLRPGGSLLVSVPNFGHWYPRIRVALGLFDYDARGILDADHVRFFTRRSFERLVREAGWTIRRREAVGIPLGVVERGGESGAGGGPLRRLLGRIDRAATAIRPQLFGYQFLYELAPERPS